MASLSTKIGGLQLSYPLLSQEQVKRTSNLSVTDFKFGGYIYMANRNKSPLKFLEKMERARIQRLPNFGGHPLLSRELAKLRTSNLAGTFTAIIRLKAY